MKKVTRVSDISLGRVLLCILGRFSDLEVLIEQLGQFELILTWVFFR